MDSFICFFFVLKFAITILGISASKSFLAGRKEIKSSASSLFSVTILLKALSSGGALDKTGCFISFFKGPSSSGILATPLNSPFSGCPFSMRAFMAFTSSCNSRISFLIFSESFSGSFSNSIAVTFSVPKALFNSSFTASKYFVTNFLIIPTSILATEETSSV